MQGEAVRAASRCSAAPTCLAFNPVSPVLAVGLSSGSLLLIRAGDGVSSEERGGHASAISVLRWSPDGSRLVTGDASGVVVVWAVAAEGGAVKGTSLATFRKPGGAITHCAFLTYPGSPPVTSLSAASDAGDSGDAAAPAATLAQLPCFPPVPGSAAPAASSVGCTVSFLFANDAGTIAYGDDASRSLDVLASGSGAVDVLELTCVGGRVYAVTVTRSLLMTRMAIASDGTVAVLMRAKVSVKGSAGMKQQVWAGGGLLVTATPDEPFIRCWDAASDDNNYTLSTTPSGRPIPKHERIQALAFSPQTAILAAGTDSGQIYLWRQHSRGSGGGSGSGSGASWEPVASVGSNGGVEALEFGAKGTILSVRLATHEVLIISEASMRRKLVWPLAAAQVSATEVSVERLGGAGGAAASPPCVMTIKVASNIKSLDVSSRHVIVWSGRNVDTFLIPEAPPAGNTPLKPSHTFKCNAADVALCADSIVLCEEAEAGARPTSALAAAPPTAAVLVVSFLGATKHTLTFAESDGVPVRVDSNGAFAAVYTSGGTLRVYDLSKQEPRLVGSGRLTADGSGAALSAPMGVTALRVSNDGTKVALLAAVSLDVQAGVATESSTSSGSAGAAASSSVLSQDAFSSSGPSSRSSSAAAASDVRSPDTRVFVYNLESDRISKYQCGPARYPVAVAWDAEDTRLFVVQTERLRGSDAKAAAAAASADSQADGKEDPSSTTSNSKEAEEASAVAASAAADFSGGEGEPDTELVSLFAVAAGSSGGDGVDAIVQQDSTPLEAPRDALLGAHTPRLYTILRADAVAPGGSRLSVQVMRDFVGMEGADAASRRALLDFSYYMATGHMDEAYRSIKSIATPALWGNMAVMCVKSKRLDVALVCLGQMGHGRGAKAVREMANEPELEANIGIVAIQLGLLADAARLFTQCGRFDLLAKMYRDSGRWDKALAIAQKHDRMHVKTHMYAQAKHLEAVGDTVGAVRAYESAGVSSREVLRMLHEQKDLRGMAEYVASQAGQPGGKEVATWYAQYMEARGDVAAARAAYERAGDTVSLVRLAFSHGDVEGAARLVDDSDSPAAAYQLARHMEAQGDIARALRYYERSGRYNHATRLAKSEGQEGQLLSLALQSDAASQLDAAAHFESVGQLDRAVQLYHKAGAVEKAVDLCFKGKLFDALRHIADDLSSSTSTAGAASAKGASPKLLKQVSDFFMTHGQYDKAVSLLLNAGQYSVALEVCVEHRVSISEAMAESMTPPKIEEVEGVPLTPQQQAAKDARTEMLLKLAAACKRQGSYHLAAKKYTQAGEKVEALKALLKSGDTEKIIFFAQVSRSREIYILTANYLQVSSPVLVRLVCCYLATMLTPCLPLSCSCSLPSPPAVAAVAHRWRDPQVYSGLLRQGQGLRAAVRILRGMRSRRNW